MTRIWGAKGYELHSLLNLNDDEKEVLRLELYGGYTRKEIADYLGINPHTVEGRWKAIAKKGKTIGLNDRWAIKGYAFQNYFEFI